MYPLTAEPVEAGNGFKYYLITERDHHFNVPMIRVGDWMAENLGSEDRAFTRAEFSKVAYIGFLMSYKKATGVDPETMLKWALYFKYYNFDISMPFMDQYLSNIETLISVLKGLK